jgi:putative oxidoreductase
MMAPLTQNIALLIGRVLLSIIFILAGVQKITGYAGTVGYMESMGVPGILLPAVIVVEVLGGLAVLIGFQTRIAAILVGGFTIVAALLFHFQPSDQIQMIMFMKNLAIAGGFLALFVAGPGKFAVDSRGA